ncbi:hypothetical protein GCM10011379_46910 [Filimonas zeae]|uniref:Uncharacterized protein n=1 Tax=Filimonas zeae TaxID=1737353 RepID=A0A917J232_9BACT|nr:hypothetical protein GCM10011379_46910 [Filimonas zeae]
MSFSESSKNSCNIESPSAAPMFLATLVAFRFVVVLDELAIGYCFYGNIVFLITLIKELCHAYHRKEQLRHTNNQGKFMHELYNN